MGTLSLSTNVSNGSDEASILVGTAEFDTAWAAGSPDFTFDGVNTVAIDPGADPEHPLVSPSGKVAFGTDGTNTPSLMCQGSFSVIDSVAYGSGYMGTADFPPAFGLDLPAAGTQVLQLQGPICHPDSFSSPCPQPRDNSVDYALVDANTSGGHPRNNLNESGPVGGDADGDGYSNVAEAGTPLCAGSANDDNMDDSFVNDGCPAVGSPESGSECENALDDDGDTFVNDGCPQVGAFSEAEFNIGTDANDRCSEGAEAGPSPAWPSDFASGGIPDSTDKITITDLTSFLASTRRLDTSPGDASFDSRWDLAPGRGLFPNWIAVNDLTALIAGTTGNPPMFGGARAFGGPACTDS